MFYFIDLRNIFLLILNISNLKIHYSPDVLSVFFAAIALLFSCQNTPNNPSAESISQDCNEASRENSANRLQEVLNAIPKDVKPVFGYRFIITGDFDGDGKKEQLIEHYFSGIDHKETNKFYENLSEFEQLVALSTQKKPMSFVVSDNTNIDTLQIHSGDQLLGLSYLRNEGDLNGDGGDEISYVINWADWSNFNTCHILTYHEHQWKEIHSFHIWDGQLPDLPDTFDQYALFGLAQKDLQSGNDTLNERVAQELKEFKGLIRKIKTNKIEVIGQNEEAEMDTMQVVLKAIE